MPEPFKVDSHVHLYQNREDAAEDKESYEIFEYGFKEDVHLSSLLGSVEEMRAAMRQAKIDRAVILNLYVATWERERFRKKAAKRMSDSELKAALRRFDLDVPERLRNFNRWGCQVAQDHPEWNKRVRRGAAGKTACSFCYMTFPYYEIGQLRRQRFTRYSPPGRGFCQRMG